MTGPQLSALYDFVYRGQLADAALDAAGRRNGFKPLIELGDISQALSMELYDEDYIGPARSMSLVYTAISAFENSVRRFVYKVLIDKYQENWWEQGVSSKIRTFAEGRRDEEEKTKWHGVRGDDLLSYTELGHLPNIMQQNWEEFEPSVRRIDWATSIFSTLERSRNVIMHSGVLAMPDIERLGILMRDWNAQVGL